MPKPVIWSPLSEKDLEAILGYLQNNWDDRVVHSFIEITDKLVNQISINPKLFPVIHEKRRIRKCVLTKHNSLFYRERKDYIDILRIFDTRQDPRKLKFK
jgi:plasmid stabilization system protein ParE